MDISLRFAKPHISIISAYLWRTMIVSDWTNNFIVTWLSYAEEELTYSLAFAPDWLTKR